MIARLVGQSHHVCRCVLLRQSTAATTAAATTTTTSTTAAALCCKNSKQSAITLNKVLSEQVHSLMAAAR